MPKFISIESASPNAAEKKPRYLKKPSRLKLIKQPTKISNFLLFLVDNNIPISQLISIEKRRTKIYLGSPQA